MDDIWRAGPEAILWKSGPWALEIRGDELANITYNDVRLVRAVRAVVRDSDWNTPQWRVAETQMDATSVTVELLTDEFGADVAATVRAEANGDVLAVTFVGLFRTEFFTNRTGLVVLHPPEVAGSPLRVAHSDGESEDAAFPRTISPHQPHFDIAGLGWSHDGIDAVIDFSGDVFEMEDQRNWTDASFKTYSRPLSLPQPYLLAAGELVEQSVTITASGSASAPSGTTSHSIQLALAGRFPAFGLGASTAPDPAPDFSPVGEELLVELDLATHNWRAALDRAALAGLPLDVRLIRDLSTDVVIDHAVAALSQHRVVRIGVFHPRSHISDPESVGLLSEALARHGMQTTVVGGARSHFTELNREWHQLPPGLDGVTVTVTPLFHSVDGAQLLESIEMQRLVAEQTITMAAELPVHIGPIALRPRFNNVATQESRAPVGTGLAEGYGAELTGIADLRQRSPQLAAWTVASAAALAVPGVASLSYFEEWGDRGIRSSDGVSFAVEAAIADLSKFVDGQLLWGGHLDGRVWAIGARHDDGDTVLIANLDTQDRRVNIELPGSDHAVDIAVPTLEYARFTTRGR